MRTRPTALVVIGTVAVLATTLSGCSLLHDDHAPLPTPSSVRHVDGRTDRSAPPTPTPTPPLVPAGTVVTETDLVSRSGDTAVHVRVVSAADDTYRVELSGYRSTVPQPMSLEFRSGVPQPGDGTDPQPVGQVRWDAGAQPPADSALGAPDDDPSFLGSVVLVPLPTDAELASGSMPSWTQHVLAVAPLTWHVPARYPDLHVTVGKAVPGAYGIVTDGPDGTPRSYLVGHGDDAKTVAERFGLTVPELEWLNPLTHRQDHWLYEGTTLNLSPGVRDRHTRR